MEGTIHAIYMDRSEDGFEAYYRLPTQTELMSLYTPIRRGVVDSLSFKQDEKGVVDLAFSDPSRATLLENLKRVKLTGDPQTLEVKDKTFRFTPLNLEQFMDKDIITTLGNVSVQRLEEPTAQTEYRVLVQGVQIAAYNLFSMGFLKSKKMPLLHENLQREHANTQREVNDYLLRNGKYLGATNDYLVAALAKSKKDDLGHIFLGEVI